MEYSISADNAEEQVEIVKNFVEVHGDVTLVVEGRVEDKDSFCKKFSFITIFFFKTSADWLWRLR